MFWSVRRMVVAASAAALVGGGANALAAEPSTQELMEQIKQLQTKVQELEKKQDQQATAASRADHERAIQDVLKDAEKRSQWLQDETFVSNYHNGKFIFRDETGNFTLHPWFQMQFRNVTNFRQDAVPGGDDNAQNGFEIRRAKFGVDGNLFTPKLTYFLNWGTRRQGGELELEQAWLKYQLDANWSLQGGQFKDPFSHESLAWWDRQLAAERSYPVVVFTGGDNYVQGVAALYTQGPFRVNAAFHDGANQYNTDFQDFPTNGADYGFATRAEYKVLGDWTDYVEFNAVGLKQDLMVVGAAIDYTEAGDTGTLLHTADAQYTLVNGWTFYGAYIARAYQNAPASSGTGAPVAATFDGYDWAIEAEAGYKFDQHWEPFARYTFTNFDQDRVGTLENEVHEITVGVNYFWYNESARFTVDATWLPNGAPISQGGTGILANDGSNEFVLRAQFQLVL
ncbi:MAG TPA: porin [Tepidisphaeraceae bacterium]|jgi:outer membrane murein-binding lipoprotein Lpp